MPAFNFNIKIKTAKNRKKQEKNRKKIHGWYFIPLAACFLQPARPCKRIAGAKKKALPRNEEVPAFIKDILLKCEPDR
jgi:hypothetical protein